MEEEIINENVITTKKKCEKTKKEIELTEKCIPVHFKTAESKEEKTHRVDLQNSLQNVTAKKKQGTDKKESIKTNRNRVLRRKLTEDGVTIERILSEGEASSGFETVSSIDSKLDFEDFQLSSCDDKEDDYNVVVQIKNDLAYPHKRDSFGRRCYWKGKSNNKIRNNSQSERFLGKYPNPRHGIFRSFKQTEHWKRDNEGAHRRYDGRDRWPREDDDFRHTRRRASCDREWSRCSDHSIRSRGSRCSDQSRRSWGSISNDYTDRRSKIPTSYRGVSRESSERNYRFIGSKSSNYRMKKMEARRSGSIDKSKSSTNRSLTCTRQTVLSKSPSTSVWKRLDNDGTRERIKKNIADRSSGSSSAGHPRKKERTPFLVELERKLKEKEKQKKVKLVDLAEEDQNKVPANVNDAVLVPEAVGSLNPNLEHTSNYTSPPNDPGSYSLRHPSIPVLSVDNLPLVPGPTGLPVHITPTGEQILHDMDGRRIPVSPNGYYLPLDPTGRLFAHIISPGNQAVPIHMTEDGVLRLPNSEPVPYGPSHNLPVNIDGSVILMGPDSRPLYPCPNLPRQPPLHLLHMTQFSPVGNWQMQMQQETLTRTQTCQVEDVQTPEVSGLEEQYSNSTYPQLQLESCLLNFTQNSHGEANKADFLMNYQKRARERKEDMLKCREIEKNLGVSPSKGGVKRSIPTKLSLKKTSKDDYYGDYDQAFDSNDFDDSDPDSASASKPSGVTKKGCLRITQEVPSNSEGAQNVFNIVCDNGMYTQSNTEDFITVKVQQALKSLDANSFKPPALGRFIISGVPVDVITDTSPNASPLLRHRVKLPYLTPNAPNGSYLIDKSAAVEKTAVVFSFLSQEKSSDKLEKSEKSAKTHNKNFNSTKLPAFTFDFSVQCDFTSAIIQNLNTKISEMEMEVVRLRNINANLLDGFRNVHEANEKKSEELGKALSEIEKRKNEILTLKHLLSEKSK